MSDLQSAVAVAARARRLLVASDFDGTLAEIVDDPAAARPMPGVGELLGRLARLPDTTVAVVSGRTRRQLQGWFGAEPLILIGEHGADLDGSAAAPSSQLDQARVVVTALVEDTPGARVEHKQRSVVFHYRQVDEERAARAITLLRERTAGFDRLSGLLGKAVIELTASETDKGEAVAALRDSLAAETVVFVGDDLTDEAVFIRLGPGDVGVKVGPEPSAARYRIEAPADVLDLLHSLASARDGVGA